MFHEFALAILLNFKPKELNFKANGAVGTWQSVA